MWTADDVVDSVFLIYLKYIDNSGFCIRFRCSSTLFIQWGRNSSDTMIGFPIAFSVAPIIIGCHWGTHSDVNVVTNSDLGQSEKYNTYLLHSNYDGTVLVNWIAIGL